MMRLIRFVAGFSVGLVLGGAIAGLFIPQSGSETRERFRGRIEAILDEGRLAAEQTRADAQARLADLKAGKAT